VRYLVVALRSFAKVETFLFQVQKMEPAIAACAGTHVAWPTFNRSAGGERRCDVARLSDNPDRNRSPAEQDKHDLFGLMAEPPARLEDIFDSPVIRQHIGELIVSAIRKSELS
jgi:hypothetical protein